MKKRYFFFSSGAVVDRHFIIQINSGADSQFTIPTTEVGYNYKVSTSDGQSFTGVTGSLTITFPDANTLYDVSISGDFPRIYFNNGTQKLKLIDIKQWGDFEWTSMYGAFQGCSNMTCSATDTPNVSSVTDMFGMFAGCTSLTTLDVSSWNVSSVTNMSYMFYNCTSLTTLDVSNWNVSSVTNMYQMFFSCTLLTTLDVSNWNVSSVTDMAYMFYQCTSLTTLDVSNWNVSSVTTMYQMFYQCTSLEMAGDGVLDFSSPIKGSISVRNISALLGTYHNAYTAKLIKELYLQCGNVVSEPAPYYGELRINYCEKVVLINMGVSMSLRANGDTTKTSMDKQGWLDLVSSIRDMTGQPSPTVTLPNNAIFTNDNDIVNAFQAKNWTVII